MNCPSCNHDKNATLESRKSPNITRRRRECLECGHRWTTSEINTEEYQGTLENAKWAEKAFKVLSEHLMDEPKIQ